LEKDRILLSLVDKVKEDKAKFNTQSEAYKVEIEDLRKKLAEANENCALAKASQEISEWSPPGWRKMLRSFMNPRKSVLKNPWIA
jgi:cell division septum initiation protein DivIVA